MSRKKYKDGDLIEAVKICFSWSQVLVKIGLKSAGGNHQTIQRRAKDLGLDSSHFMGQRWRKGTNVPSRRAVKLEEILVKDSTYATGHLHKRLLKEKVKEHKCEGCKQTEWMSKPIPLELDHINGNRFDHRIENLRFLCPNCHAQTDTYGGKNIGCSKRNF